MNEKTEVVNENEEAQMAELATNHIRDEFAVHILNKDGLERAGELAKQFSSFLDGLEATCGVGGREMALVRTKLQEASYYAKRAIAMLPENQEL